MTPRTQLPAPRFGRAAAICLIVGVVALWVLLVTGCGPSERNTGRERGTAPVSALSQAEAHALAALTAAHAGGSWGSIAPTGSMEPILASNTTAIYAPYRGELAVGMVVVFWRDAASPRVLHRVAALNSTHFIGDGIANARGDGWHPRSNITDVLVGVIYHERVR